MACSFVRSDLEEPENMNPGIRLPPTWAKTKVVASRLFIFILFALLLI